MSCRIRNSLTRIKGRILLTSCQSYLPTRLKVFSIQHRNSWIKYTCTFDLLPVTTTSSKLLLGSNLKTMVAAAVSHLYFFILKSTYLAINVTGNPVTLISKFTVRSNTISSSFIYDIWIRQRCPFSSVTTLWLFGHS
jgi:hypothetical protein